MIEAGADVNTIDPAGNTPLHVAVVRSYIPDDTIITEMLLKSGADIHVQNADGETPLTLAVQEKRTAHINLLLKAHDLCQKNDA